MVRTKLSRHIYVEIKIRMEHSETRCSGAVPQIYIKPHQDHSQTLPFSVRHYYFHADRGECTTTLTLVRLV